MATAGDIIGRYRLVTKLGEGAMGVVWKANHTTLGTPVAVKLIHAETARNETALARFQREALLSARLKSAHVVQIIDHGEHHGLPFIAMEYLDGQSLADRLRRGRMSIVETHTVVKHVCRALAKAHELGLVHRDIKPANLMVCRGEEEGEIVIKVLDFGIAKVADDLGIGAVVATKTGAMMGTPFYLSPEQAKGLKTVGPAADLWAVSVVAFECLTGRRPFTAPAMGPLIAKIIHEPLPVPSQWAPDAGLPPEIDAWMHKALQREPEQRFASAKDLAEAFAVAAGLSDSLSGARTASPGADTVVWRGDDGDLAKTAILDDAHGFDAHSLDGAQTIALPPPGGLPIPPAGAPLPPADEPMPRAAIIDQSWPLAPTPVSSRAPMWVAAAVALLALLGGVGWWLTRSAAPSVAGEERAPAPSVAPRDPDDPPDEEASAPSASAPSASAPAASAPSARTPAPPPPRAAPPPPPRAVPPPPPTPPPTQPPPPAPQPTSTYRRTL